MLVKTFSQHCRSLQTKRNNWEPNTQYKLRYKYDFHVLNAKLASQQTAVYYAENKLYKCSFV
jgi:hypothetical protein